MILYVSGPMSGLPDWGFPAFHDAAGRLRTAGYAVLNPADNFGGDTSLARRHYMRLDLLHVLSADGVAVLDGWQQSSGATLEVNVAGAVGLTVRTVDEWEAMREPVTTIRVTDHPGPSGNFEDFEDPYDQARRLAAERRTTTVKPPKPLPGHVK